MNLQAEALERVLDRRTANEDEREEARALFHALKDEHTTLLVQARQGR